MPARIVQTILEPTANAVRSRLESLPAGIDLVELRFDGLEEPCDPQSLVMASPLAVVATARRASEGGFFRGSESERIALLERAAQAGAAYVDLEDGVPWRRDLGPTRLIRSFHDLSGVPRDLDERARRLSHDATIVKVACNAHHMDDVRRVLELPHRMQLPTVAIAMGPLGRFARIAAGAFGMPLTYASTPGTAAAAPGQVPADEMAQLYRANRIDHDWRLALEIGTESDGADSALTLDAALAAAGVRACLVPASIPSMAALDELLPLLPWQAMIVGPTLAEPAASWAPRCSDSARTVGGADFLFKDGEAWCADCLLVEALSRAIGTVVQAAACRGRRAWVFGADFAARVAARALRSLGADVHIVADDEPRAKSAADRLGVRAITSLEAAPSKADIIVLARSHGRRDDGAEASAPRSAFLLIEMTAVHASETAPGSRNERRSVVSRQDILRERLCLQYERLTGNSPDPAVIKRALSRTPSR
ncbi:MAG: type I 3-dehydroquinate dehydratase [Planctomycetota bacterium]